MKIVQQMSYLIHGEMNVRKYEIYQFYKQTTLIPYAKELIELLHSKGYILGIMTNGTASMEYHQSLNSLFSVLVNPENCGGSKPDLAPFTKVFFIVLNFIDR